MTQATINPSVAATLAVICGKIPPSQVNRSEYMESYNDAENLYKNNYIVIIRNGQMIVYHNPPTWTRRVR